MANRISIARELSESGDHVSAVNAWKTLLEEDRQSSDIWNGMADALSAAGHVDRAFQCSQRAKAIEEAIANDEEIEIEEGAIDLITAGEEAKERLDNIEPTENEDVNISIEWYNRGVGLLGEGQPIEALNCFEKAIGSAPREELSLRVKSQGGRGHALYQLGRYGDSIRSYHTAISMDPSGVTARMLYNMGSSYAALELFEDAINPLEAANIKLEYDDEEGIIILDATDSSLSDAGDSLDLEDELRIRNVDVVLLEENNVFVSEGHIPLSNYTLNSTSVITRGNVHSAEISVRSTGEVALEDATDTTHGFLLEETSGDNLDLEGATGITH